MTKNCVFNPGVVYQRHNADESFQFFNVRASSLAEGGDLFNITAGYPDKKIVTVESDDPHDYRLTDLDMFMRRAYKRVNWLKRKVSGLPVPRGPIGEVIGNRIVTSNLSRP
jgi:hypothetical protein